MTIELCYPCRDRSLWTTSGVVDTYAELMRKWYSELYDGREIECECCGDTYEYSRTTGGYVGNKRKEERNI